MPVLVPEFKLKLGRCTVKAVSNIRVTLSRKLLCDVAEIELPLLAETDLSKLKEGGAATGGEVEISLGWEGAEPEPVFTGVITEVLPNQPLVIKCEDHGHALKTTRFQKTFKKANIGPLGGPETWYSEIAAYAIAQAGLTPEISDLYVGTASDDIVDKSVTIDHQTCMQVMEKLRENGWDSFCIPCTKEFYYGPDHPWAYGVLKQDRTFKFSFKDLRVLGKIEYAPIIAPQGFKFTPGDKIGKVIVHLVNSEFTKPAVHGEHPPKGEGGEPVKEFSITGSYEKKEDGEEKAATLARNLYYKYNAPSIEGAIKIFGNQFIKHSEQVMVRDPDHPERCGPGQDLSFVIDEVVHEFGPSVGFKTSLTLCQKQEKR